jgi:hypothetical protein
VYGARFIAPRGGAVPIITPKDAEPPARQALADITSYKGKSAKEKGSKGIGLIGDKIEKFA